MEHSGIPIVDCRGMVCPFPILHIRLRINELSPGDELIAFCDDLSFEGDLERFCRLASLSCTGKMKNEGYTAYSFLLIEPIPTNHEHINDINDL
jgi:TusA-related sulfurtransferase